jgi:glycerophosphoryl diester phosphodiesterase
MNSILIAHRGEPETWPENSLAGYEAVLSAGARYIETDIQLTADGIPILSHDPSLLKITGRDLTITETDYKTVASLPAGYPERFGDKYQDFRITRLDQLVELLKQWPEATLFAEIKCASIVAHGTAAVVDTIMEALQPIRKQCILISFDYDALVYARKQYALPVGWVLPEWSAANQALSAALGPEYLFCNRKRLPSGSQPLWQGPWQWAIYTINATGDIAPYLDRGAALIETNVITRLLADAGLEGTRRV